MMMLNLAGYQEALPIYTGSRTLVYRAIRATDEQSVIIKVLRNPHPNFDDLVRFRNQYIITRNLEHPAIVQPLSLERYVNGYALVMLDEGALSLLEYWQESGGNLSKFLTIALQLAQALHYLGQQRIIHKDIKPSNILIHPQSHQVKLIDFSISSLLPKEQQLLLNPNVLEGTLAYISPEQTGRMNRRIDYRTDFYSLGVTLYELLTGVLPFQSNDPVELLHCHIAKEPLAPDELLDIQGNPYPEAISQIILKLMAKNAEERYQSALGLQHDLERCWQQWEAKEKITPFELGEHDICDRFLIPEKLYGREKEVESLLAVFDRVAHSTSEMMLVAGFSGIGKTAVVNEVHKPIVEKRGYFIKGKFDQFNRNVPFSAFLQAFRNLMGQLLGESDAALKTWKEKILDAVGVSGQVILEMIPELERIIGKQPTVPELSGSAAQNRFNLLFSKFVQVFTTQDYPLVIFLDDLQWVDSASLKLLKLLMNESQTGYLLLLGAYRDNEVLPAHPLMLSLDEIQKRGAKINTLTLAPLDEVDINRLVADTLLCSLKAAAPLSQLVYQKTQGNPFFATQFLQGLYKDGCIKFDLAQGRWQCHLTQVRQLALTDDVVEFMVGRLQKLPASTQDVLKLAACIGNRFDLATLAVVCESSQEEVASNLWHGLQEGFIIPESETYKFFQGDKPEEKEAKEVSVSYRFLHDRVQQATYSLIVPQLKKQTHLKIGQLLLRNTPPEQKDANIFTIINQLNHSIELIDTPCQREELAQLNLKAGQKAKLATAYEASVNYLKIGLNLLEIDSWETQYNLTLGLHIEALEAEYLNTNIPEAQSLAAIIRQKATHQLDIVKVSEIEIQIYTNHFQMPRALETGLQELEILGLSQAQIWESTQKELTLPQLEDVEYLKEMENPHNLAVMRLLTSLYAPAINIQPQLMWPIALTEINLCLLEGHSALSAVAYVIYGMLLCAKGSIQQGYRAGQLGMELLDHFNTQAIRCQVSFTFSTQIQHWQEPIRDSLEPMLDALQIGLETGDLVYGAFCAQNYCSTLFLVGENLEQVENKQNLYTDLMRKIQSEYIVTGMRVWQQLNANLRSLSSEPHRLVGEYMDEEVLLPQLQTDQSAWLIFEIYLAKTFLCYLLGDNFEALTHAAKMKQYLQSVGAALVGAVSNFYYSLVLLTESSQVEPELYQEYLEQVANNQGLMEYWAAEAPMNFQHKYDLVAAEKSRVLGQKLEAIELYDQAISGAKENKYIQEEALANELAAKFYLDWGKETIAEVYMQKAYYCYARWGAKAKTDQLEAKYPQLLALIIQKQQIEFNPLDTLESLTQTLTKTSSIPISDILDLASILQAAQNLSNTIELDQLIEDIVRIVLTNAGAQKAVLLTPQAEEWQLLSVAKLTEDGTVETSKRSQFLTAESSVPIRVIQYVKNTREPVLIDEGKTDISGIIEGYLLEYQPQSVLCVPLLNQGQLVAIIYLEHSTTKGVFTPNRLTIIQFLCAQAAVSLQNAQLYHQSQQAQLQLIQSEKMSTLGNLVAGVAHEINNPTGFLQGNIQPAQDYVQDLLGLVELLLAKCPSNDPQITEEIEEIDLDFIREDLPKLLGSMHLGVNRISNLSHSLCTFSRQEQDQKVGFNIHQGIDSTLVILNHRLKANDKRTKIEVVKDYQEIPEVQCFPSQLNQVFMNILANAIDTFDEANQCKSYSEIEANPNIITIDTSAIAENQIQIQIKDNGCGMSRETQQRIFEQGFTTKEVGKGTGLGMAIAYQIITDKHGGTITCDSTIGQGTTFTIVLPISG